MHWSATWRSHQPAPASPPYPGRASHTCCGARGTATPARRLSPCGRCVRGHGLREGRWSAGLSYVRGIQADVWEGLCSRVLRMCACSGESTKVVVQCMEILMSTLAALACVLLVMALRLKDWWRSRCEADGPCLSTVCWRIAGAARYAGRVRCGAALAAHTPCHHPSNRARSDLRRVRRPPGDGHRPGKQQHIRGCTSCTC